MAIKCPRCHFENTDTSTFCSACAASLRPEGELPFSATTTYSIPLPSLPKGRLFARKYTAVEEIGWGGQRIYVFPSLQLVVVFTGGNHFTLVDPEHAMLAQYILPAVH